jgi:hypothetical protein
MADLPEPNEEPGPAAERTREIGYFVDTSTENEPKKRRSNADVAATWTSSQSRIASLD